jgi:hypothetical protein
MASPCLILWGLCNANRILQAYRQMQYLKPNWVKELTAGKYNLPLLKTLKIKLRPSVCGIFSYPRIIMKMARAIPTWSMESWPNN